jgi:metallo-beta-lactamase family protein
MHAPARRVNHAKEARMRITFWGAARAVTGSRHLLEVRGAQYLLDCGLVQGRREEAEAANRYLPFDAAQIAAVVLSHAHIDHSGNLPTLVKHGFAGPIHATRATVGLLTPMLRDSAHIQERDVEFVNKRHSRQGKPLKAPLYTLADAERTLPRLTPQSYGDEFTVGPGVRAHFRDAGHILGSALTVLDLEEGGRRLRLGFTGDLGRAHLPIIRDPETLPDLDALIIESTYGDRVHEESALIPAIMEEILKRAHAQGSKILIPAFAVGRAQEIVMVLNELFNAGRVPEMPVYIDSPLAVDVTQVFRAHPECFDEETLALLHAPEGDPFGFKRMHYVRDVQESIALNSRPGPMIVIAASGMCEAGRILHHLRNNIDNPNTLILIVGYQAEQTLGRRLVENADEVRIFGEVHRRRAQVRVLDAFSAHADRDELLAWVRRLERKPRRVYVVHGEEEPALHFADLLKDEGCGEISVPRAGESFVL